MVTKFDVGDDVGDPTPVQNFTNPMRGFCFPSHPRAHSDSVSFLYFLERASGDAVQPGSLHRFTRSIREMTSFCARMCLLGPKNKIYISTPFSTKTEIFDQFLTWAETFASKKALTALNRHRSPMKVVYWTGKSGSGVGKSKYGVIGDPLFTYREGLLWPTFRISGHGTTRISPERL